MSKTTSIVLLCVLTVLLLALTVVFCLPSEVEISKNGKLYVSPLFTLNKGNDIGEGVLATFNVTRPDGLTEEEYQAKLNQTIVAIRDRFTNVGYSDVSISYSDSNVVVRIPSTAATQETLSSLTSRGLFEAKYTKDEVATVLLGNEHIRKCTTGYNSNTGTYNLAITLTKEGQRLLESLETGLTVSFYIDESTTAFGSLETPFTGNMIGFSADSEDNLRALALVLQTQPLDLTLTLADAHTTTPEFGENASLLTACVALFLLVALIVALCITYKLQGVATGLVIIFNSVLLLLFASLVNAGEFSTAGLFAFIFVTAVFALTCKAIFDKSKEAYISVVETDASTKIALAMERGRSFYTPVILKSYILGIFAAIALWIFSIGAIKSFAVITVFGLAISLLSSLFVLRFVNFLFVNIKPDPTALGLAAKEVQK